MKHYKLIVQDRYSLSNETDSDIMSDYSPGIWAIKTQKSALKFAKEILAEGNTIEVTDYDNPRYHSLANWFIKELGLSQPLFNELVSPMSDVTNDKPRNLSAFKKYLTVGMKLRIINHRTEGDTERMAEVLSVGVSNFTLTKSETSRLPSWSQFDKASDWSFHNDCAIRYYVVEGNYQKSTSYFYQ